MSMFDAFVAVILGIVEGLTEFIPVSSTGHLIVAGHLLGFEGEKAATFEVVIQMGAILAVAVLYRHRLESLRTLRRLPGFAGQRGWLLLILATLPAGVLGMLAHGAIKEHLFSPTTVAIGWGVGGVAILLLERFKPDERVCDLDQVTWRGALGIGLFQCLALWPGISRAAATIGGGMIMRLGRTTASEFSFIAAIPIIAAASAYDLMKSWHLLSMADVPFFVLGFLVAFIFAWLSVTLFLRILQVSTLRPFGWYRIVAAAIALAVITWA
jgi:undecaprenyl-diphosphatase